jgi:hypothetical protein
MFNNGYLFIKLLYLHSYLAIIMLLSAVYFKMLYLQKNEL